MKDYVMKIVLDNLTENSCNIWGRKRKQSIKVEFPILLKNEINNIEYIPFKRYVFDFVYELEVFGMQKQYCLSYAKILLCMEERIIESENNKSMIDDYIIYNKNYQTI